MPRVVTIRDPETERDVDRPFDGVAMQVPDGFPTNGEATVCGDDVTFVDSMGESRVVRTSTRRFGYFADGETCLVPTNRRDGRGRTLWRVARVLRADHFVGPN